MMRKNVKRDQQSELATFNLTIDRLLSVPRVEIERREDRYLDEAEANPRKRGPKRKQRR